MIVKDFFDNKYDESGPLSEIFIWPLDKIAGISGRKFAEFKKDVRVEFNIMKNDAISRTPIDTGKMIRSWYFSLVITPDNVNLSVKNKTDYINYQNSGSQKQSPRDFLTEPMINFEKDLMSLLKEYAK